MFGERKSIKIDGEKFTVGMIVEVIKDYRIKYWKTTFRKGEIREVKGIYEHGMDRNGMILRIAIDNYPSRAIPISVVNEYIKKFEDEEEIVKFKIGDMVNILAAHPPNEAGVHYHTYLTEYEIIRVTKGYKSEYDDWELQNSQGYYQYVTQKEDYRFMEKV